MKITIYLSSMRLRTTDLQAHKEEGGRRPNFVVLLFLFDEEWKRKARVKRFL